MPRQIPGLTIGGLLSTLSVIFAAQTLGFPMGRLIVLHIVVQFSAVAGALAWAKPSDRLGPKLTPPA